MSNIRIVTDSTADLTPELVARYGIKVVPLEVLADGKAYKDKIDITNDEYYEILRTAKTLPTTSQPSPAVFADTYQALAAEGAEHIISIQISSELSGTYQSSVLAASLVADTVTVHNFDSRTATMGLGLIVLSAARMVEEGRSLEEILAQVEYMIQNSDLYFLSCRIYEDKAMIEYNIDEDEGLFVIIIYVLLIFLIIAVFVLWAIVRLIKRLLARKVRKDDYIS